MYTYFILNFGTLYVYIYYIKINFFFTSKSNDFCVINTHEFPKSTLDKLFQTVDYSPFWLPIVYKVFCMSHS